MKLGGEVRVPRLRGPVKLARGGRVPRLRGPVKLAGGGATTALSQSVVADLCSTKTKKAAIRRYVLS